MGRLPTLQEEGRVVPGEEKCIDAGEECVGAVVHGDHAEPAEGAVKGKNDRGGNEGTREKKPGMRAPADRRGDEHQEERKKNGVGKEKFRRTRVRKGGDANQERKDQQRGNGAINRMNAEAKSLKGAQGHRCSARSCRSSRS
jgi:hypothetical protein